MIPALQDPYLPNPFSDTPECEATRGDTPFDPNNPADVKALSELWDSPIGGTIIHTHGPGQLTTHYDLASPNDQLEIECKALYAKVERLQAELSQACAENKALSYEIDNLRNKLDAAQKYAMEHHAMAKAGPQMITGGRRIGKTQAARENESIYKLCAEFPQINTVDFAVCDYECAIRCDVVTSDGHRHFHQEQRVPNRDTIGMCEDAMRKFLLSQGYLHTNAQAMSMSNCLGTTPRPPGQPPKHDMGIASRPIIGGDLEMKVDTIGEYQRAMQQAALTGTGMMHGNHAIDINSIWADEYQAILTKQKTGWNKI